MAEIKRRTIRVAGRDFEIESTAGTDINAMNKRQLIHGPMDRLCASPERENDVWVPLDDGRLCIIAGPLFRRLLDIFEEHEQALRLRIPSMVNHTVPPGDAIAANNIHKETFEPVKYLEEESTIWKTGFIKV